MGKWTEAQKAKAHATRAKNKRLTEVKRLGTAAPDLRVRDAIALLKQAETHFMRQKRLQYADTLCMLALHTLMGEV